MSAFEKWMDNELPDWRFAAQREIVERRRRVWKAALTRAAEICDELSKDARFDQGHMNCSRCRAAIEAERDEGGK